MLGKLHNNQHIYIYGAGFAGLSLAYRLKQMNIPFTLYEKEKVGGKISTTLTKYGPMEAAASTLYLNAEVEELLNELEIPYLQAQKKLKRWVYLKEGPVSPFNLRLIFQLLLKITNRFPKVNDHSTVEDIFLPLLGRKYVDELLSCVLQGIHGAEAKDLHFLSIFSFAKNKNFTSYFSFFKSFIKEMKKGSSKNIKGSVSFPGGMQTLIDRLHLEVKENIKFVPEVFKLEKNTIICTSALDAASLLEKTYPNIAKELLEIEYRAMTSVSIILKKEITELKESFGMLIPQKFGSNILGVIHQSAIFPDNYSAFCYSMICKGIREKSDVVEELKKLIPQFQSTDILEISSRSWEAALPLYDEKRHNALKNIDVLLSEQQGLILFGNYTNGISLRSMIDQTRSTFH